MRKIIPILILLAILGFTISAFASPKGISVAKVTGTDIGSNVVFTNPYPPHGNMNVFAGTFAGTIDSNTASFYCTDLAHYLAIFPPHTYVDSGYAGSYISYILKNYYPTKTYPYAGAMNTVQKEAAAIQLAIWIFSDGLDYSTINNAPIRDRAKEIEDDALLHAGVTTPVQTLVLTPISLLNYCDVKDTVKVRVLDENGNPVSGTTVTFSITSGTLSAASGVTGADGYTPRVIITKGTDSTATFTARAKVKMTPGTLYIHGTDPANYQKLVCAKPCFGYQRVMATITCNASSPGGAGGVESSYNMAEALLQRHIKIENGETSMMVSNQNDFFSITYPLNTVIPISGPFSTTATVVTPFDILGISNATSAYAVDYKYGNGQRVGSIFSTTTNAPNIYSHSKVICDRLSGSELRNISIENLGDKEFYMAELANYKNHTVDYSISFSIYETGSGLVVDNKWTIPEYTAPAGTTNIYNFQCWGANREMAIELVKKVLAKYESLQSVRYSTTPLKNPDVYLKQAKYTNDGKIKFTFNNTTANTVSVPFTFVITSQQGLPANTVNQTISVPSGEYTYTFNSLGYLSSASVTLTNSTEFKDAAFVGGGVYGGFAGSASTVSTFTNLIVSGTPTVPANSLVFTGGARLTGTLNDKLYISRSLDASYGGVDLRNCSKIRFEVQGAGTMAVYLEAKVNGNYVYPYVNIPVTSSFTTKEINLSSFIVNGQPVDLSSVSMITYQMDKGSNPSLNNVDFSVRNAVVIANSVGIGENNGTVKDFSLSQNYPNPFNPVTKISYSIPSKEFVSLKVFDVLGKEVAVLVNETKSTGIYEAIFDASKLSSGVYFYKLETSSFSDVKRMIVTK
ncbi:MAG: T9SS type A sorting domain-containing protein [Bacteroidetes bacterium]|nr:T9SS type A sorting domain-containing protein [Bacteroidota bacterium]